MNIFVCAPAIYAACELRDFIQEELPNASLRLVNNVSQAREELQSAKYDWLIAWEDALEEEDASFEPNKSSKTAMMKLLDDWIEADTRTRRAMVISNKKSWMDLEFTSNVIGIRGEELHYLKDFIVDVLETKESPGLSSQPTIIRILIEDKNVNGEKSPTLLYGGASGPFELEVEKELPRVFPCKVRMGTLPPDVGEKIETFRRIREDMEDLCDRLQQCHKSVLNHWKVQDRSNLFPLHLHFVCEPQYLASCVDLAMEKYSDIVLCDRFPIVWRIVTEHGESQKSVRHTADAVRVIYSFVNGNGKYQSISNVQNHSQSVSQQLCHDLEPKHVVTAEEFKEEIGRPADQPISAIAYVITHGEHDDNHPDNSSLVLENFREENPQFAEIVSAISLATGDPNRRLRFAYLNCCHLGEQKGDHAGSFHGGFCQALLAKGVAEEVISNRWEVAQAVSMPMAESFFGNRRRSVYSRSVALLRARKIDAALKHPMHRLAPIHIWAREA